IYHKSIGFPAHFRRPVGRFPLHLTDHVKEQSVRRGITLRSHIDFRDLDIIEAGFEGTRLNHILVRMVHDSTNDVCIAIAVNKGRMVAKSAWLCHKFDYHTTLNESPYARP